MKLLGIGDVPVDVSKEENLSTRVFSFCPNKEDYFADIHLNWDRIHSDVYRLVIGGYTFDIGAGLYVLIANEDTNMYDWLVIDEIIGRDVSIFCLTPNVSHWSFEDHRLESIAYGVYYLPSIRTPLLVTSNCGSRCILVSTTDQYRATKDKDLIDMFVL